MTKKRPTAPDWEELLRDATSGDVPLMFHAAQKTYHALLQHFLWLGFEKPKAYQFRNAVLKAATGGFVPGAILNDYSETVYYLRNATHGSRTEKFDPDRGRLSVLTVRKFWNMVMPCVEVSGHLEPSPETRQILTEVLKELEKSNAKTLRYYHERAVSQLDQLKRHTGSKDNFTAAVTAANSGFISGALAMQLIFAANDHSAFKRFDEGKGEREPTSEEMIRGMRSICALFGMAEETLWLTSDQRRSIERATEDRDRREAVSAEAGQRQEADLAADHARHDASQERVWGSADRLRFGFLYEAFLEAEAGKNRAPLEELEKERREAEDAVARQRSASSYEEEIGKMRAKSRQVAEEIREILAGRKGNR